MVAISEVPQKVKNKSFLSHFSDAELASVVSHATIKAFRSGEKILAEGECGTTMLLILSGKLKVQRKEHLIGIRNAGSLVGEMSFIDPTTRSASVFAMGKGSCLVFERSDLLRLVEQGDLGGIKLFQEISAIICERLREVNQLIVDEVEGTRKEGHNLFHRFLGKL